MSSVLNADVIKVPFAARARICQLASSAYLADSAMREELDRLWKCLKPGADLRPDLVVKAIEVLHQSAERKWRKKSAIFREAQQASQGKKKGGGRHPKTAA